MVDKRAAAQQRLQAELDEHGEAETLRRFQQRQLDTIEDVQQRVSRRCKHDWQEQPGEPPVDVCNQCGAVRS